MRKRCWGIVLFAIWASLLWGQSSPSAIRLGSGGKITNAIIYQNSGYKPISTESSVSYSASDSVMSGTKNIHLTDYPFTDRFRIDTSSPAFNNGTLDGSRISDTLDLDGNPRVSCENIDMGAFEFQDSPTTITQQPQSVRTVLGALPVSLSVAADGRNLRYQWQHNGLNLTEQTSQTLQLGGHQADTGVYRVIVYGDCCNDTSVEVSIKYDPWSFQSDGECPDEKSWIKIRVDGPEYSYLWHTGSKDSIIKDVETGRYQVKITDTKNRFVNLDFDFAKYSPIALTHSIVNADNITCDNGTIQISVLDTNYTYDFQWQHNETFFSSDQNLSNAPFGIYQLSVQRQSYRFCPSDTFNFALSCSYKHRMLAAYLSPNGDGLNDYLDISNIEHYPKNTVTIINSYGDKVFSVKNYDNTSVFWDGRNRNGKIVPDGVYYYIVETEGFEVMAGWLVMKLSTSE